MIRSFLTAGLALTTGAFVCPSALAQEGPAPGLRGPRAPGSLQERWKELRETRHEAREAFKGFLESNPELRDRLAERRRAFREEMRARVEEFRAREGARPGGFDGLRGRRGGRLEGLRGSRFQNAPRFEGRSRFPGIDRGRREPGPRRRPI